MALNMKVPKAMYRLKHVDFFKKGGGMVCVHCARRS